MLTKIKDRDTQDPVRDLLYGTEMRLSNKLFGGFTGKIYGGDRARVATLLYLRACYIALFTHTYTDVCKLHEKLIAQCLS